MAEFHDKLLKGRKVPPHCRCWDKRAKVGVGVGVGGGGVSFFPRMSGKELEAPAT